jgi:hypothetical protein
MLPEALFDLQDLAYRIEDREELPHNVSFQLFMLGGKLTIETAMNQSSQPTCIANRTRA